MQASRPPEPSGTVTANKGVVPTTNEVLPHYLVRYYRWAYLWPLAVRILDHQPLINLALFGHSRRIMNQIRRIMGGTAAGKTLQVAAVYGSLIPMLSREVSELHVAEIAPVQIRATERKLAAAGSKAQVARMNAECLTYESASFDTALMFFLLHELPPDARRNSLREAMRVLRPDGRLLIAEYGECNDRHLFHRLAVIRWIFTRWEPFLAGFWTENLTKTLEECAANAGKGIELEERMDIFGGFYRVLCYRVTPQSAEQVTK